MSDLTRRILGRSELTSQALYARRIAICVGRRFNRIMSSMGEGGPVKSGVS